MDKKAVIEKFGKPTAVKKSSKGQVLIYKREQDISASDGRMAVMGTSTKTYTFTIDKKGKVSAWKIEPKGPKPDILVDPI